MATNIAGGNPAAFTSAEYAAQQSTGMVGTGGLGAGLRWSRHAATVRQHRGRGTTVPTLILNGRTARIWRWNRAGEA